MLAGQLDCFDSTLLFFNSTLLLFQIRLLTEMSIIVNFTQDKRLFQEVNANLLRQVEEC